MILKSMIILFGIIFVIAGIIFGNRKNNKTNIVFYRNIFINIGLIIFSGLLFLLYEKLFNKIYSGIWPSMFLGIIVMLYILFSNFIGILLSTIYSKRVYLTLIIYGLFIVSTVIIYNLINITVNLLVNKKIISECSSIIFIAILIIIENIVAYLISKNIIRINSRVRSNFV